MNTRICRWCSLGAALAFLTLAAPCTWAALNATIINGDVHLRASYPTYRTSTLWTFQLSPGASLTIIPNGSKVEVLRKKIVADRQEWLETKYVSNGRSLTGWVYAGDVGGKKKYVQLDPDVRIPVVSSGGGTPDPLFWANFEGVLFGTAHAQSTAPVKEPPVPTDSLRTFGFVLANVAVYLASLFAIRKWIFPTSPVYSFGASLCILLIQGYVSQEVFGDLLAKLFTKGVG